MHGSKIEVEINLYIPRCLKSLRYGGLTKEQLAVELDLSVPHTLSILSRLECDGKIKRVAGKYQVKEVSR